MGIYFKEKYNEKLEEENRKLREELKREREVVDAIVKTTWNGKAQNELLIKKEEVQKLREVKL